MICSSKCRHIEGLLLQPALDANYKAVKRETWAWPTD